MQLGLQGTEDGAVENQTPGTGRWWDARPHKPRRKPPTSWSTVPSDFIYKPQLLPRQNS